jgi:hypothetical protein
MNLHFNNFHLLHFFIPLDFSVDLEDLVSFALECIHTSLPKRLPGSSLEPARSSSLDHLPCSAPESLSSWEEPFPPLVTGKTYLFS